MDAESLNELIHEIMQAFGEAAGGLAYAMCGNLGQITLMSRCEDFFVEFADNDADSPPGEQPNFLEWTGVLLKLLPEDHAYIGTDIITGAAFGVIRIGNEAVQGLKVLRELAGE